MDQIDARIKELADKGCRADEVMARLSMSKSAVYRRAKLNGIEWKYEKKYRKKDHSDILAYKAEGHTAKETAEHFGISEDYAKEITRGIAPQSHCRGNQWQRLSQSDSDARVSAIVAERLSGFEYVGNYTGSDGTADVACKTCGTVKRLSWASIRHGVAGCECCRAREIEQRKAQRQAQAEREKQERANRTREQRNANYWKNRKCRQIEFNICPVCGTIAYDKQYCSVRCRRKAENKRKEIARRTKVRNQIVDKDITLKKLYARDSGICYLCGGMCNWDDWAEQGGTIVCGDLYPSIDHIVPLSAGGKHSWKNVKLAHRICNSIKSDTLLA